MPLNYENMGNDNTRTLLRVAINCGPEPATN